MFRANFLTFLTSHQLWTKNTMPTLRKNIFWPTPYNCAKTGQNTVGECTLQIRWTTSHTSHRLMRLLTHETARRSTSDDNARNTARSSVRRIAHTCTRIIDRDVFTESLRQTAGQNELKPGTLRVGFKNQASPSGPSVDCPFVWAAGSEPNPAFSRWRADRRPEG